MRSSDRTGDLSGKPGFNPAPRKGQPSVGRNPLQQVGDPADRRAWRVRLTSAGRRSFRAMADEHEKWIVQMFAGLPSRDIAQLNELLGRVKTHLRTSNEDEA